MSENPIQPPSADTLARTGSSKDDASSNPAIESFHAKTAKDMPGIKIFLVWLAISLAVLCTFLDEGIIATAIPRISDQFHSLADIGWYGSAYQMTLCAFQFVFGRLYSQFNIKIVFLTSLAIFEIGSLVCAVSPTSAAFIVGRTVAGIGAAGLQSGSLVLISSTLPSKNLPLYVGGLGMMYGIAAVIGPVAGGLITNSYLTWRWCFYINLPIAALPAIAIPFLIKSPPQTDEQMRPWLQKVREFDHLGMILLLPAIGSFILGLQFGGAVYSWGNGRTIACFVVAGVLVIAFAAEQWWMGDKALVPPRIMKMRVVIAGSLFAFCLDSAFFTLVYYLPLWFQAIQGTSPEQSGVRYLALCIAFIITIFFSGWAVTKTGYYQPFMLGGTVLVSVGAGLLSSLKVSSGLNLWLPFQVIAGLGIGMATQQPAVAVQSLLAEGDVAIGVGAVMFFQCFGPTTFITAAQAVFASTLVRGIREHIPGVDAKAIAGSGATLLADLVPSEDLPVLLEIYNHALTRTFLVASVVAAASILGVVGIGLKRIPDSESNANTEDSENVAEDINPKEKDAGVESNSSR